MRTDRDALFSADAKKGLERADALRHAGAEDAAQKLFVICVKDAAKTKSHGDALELFYGVGVYDRDFDIETAARYIYVAACAKKTLEVLDDKGAADDGIAPWAEPSDKTTAAVADFFVWLTGSKRKPAKDDDKLFAKFLYAVNDGAKVKLGDRLESFEPVELIEMAVDGRMTVSGGGMKWR